MTPGTRLGPYEIVARIGAGGMGEVYQARDTRLDRTVAIKVSAQQFSERFEREARAVAALNHPNICTLHDVGPDYIVMEHIQGHSLKGPLPVEEALRYAVQIAAALDAAHRQGIIHRDLKPGNILITKTGVKLLDFGLAKQSRGREAAASDVTVTIALTQEHSLIGTLQYMSPEQFEGKEADARSDIFAFGLVLYEMLTGRPAFSGSSQASLIAAIMEREPAPVGTAQPLTPAALERVVKKCLAKDPDARWQTAVDLRDELQWIAAGGATPAVSAAPTQRSRLPLIIAGVAIAGIAAAAGLLLRPKASAPPLVQLEIPVPDGARFASLLNGGPGAISPDGHKVVLLLRMPDGMTRLWLRDLASPAPRPLAGTDGAGFAFWSPDSRSIAFFADQKLRRLDLGGSEPRTICAAPALDFAFSGAWGSKGVIVFERFGLGLAAVPASGGEPRDILTTTGSPDRRVYANPVFLPDGDHFLYMDLTRAPKPSLMAASLGDPSSRKALPVSHAASYSKGYLLFVEGRRLVARPFDAGRLEVMGNVMTVAELPSGPGGLMTFSVSSGDALFYGVDAAAESSRFVWYDRDGMPSGSVGEPDLWDSFRLSSDGRRIAANRFPVDAAGAARIFALDTVRGAAVQVTPGDGYEQGPVWSPDGRRIAFTSNRVSMRNNLWVTPASGSATPDALAEMTPSSTLRRYAEDWSRDGRFLLFSTYTLDSRRDLWALPLEGRQPPVTVAGAAANESEGRFSPDGKAVAFLSDESGRAELYLQPFAPGQLPSGKIRVSTEGAVALAWRGDGTEFYFITPDRHVMAVPVRSGSGHLEPGEPHTLFHEPSMAGQRGYPIFDVTPDGKKFLFLESATTAPPKGLTVMLNWQQAMQQ